MAKLSNDDLDFLWTHLGELARAARTRDDLRIHHVIARLVAESDNPAAMAEACTDALARLAGYGHSTHSRSSTTRSESHRAPVDVGDVVQALAPPEWAGKQGFVVFVDPCSDGFSIGVEFWQGDRVAMWMFAADQLQHPHN